MSRNMAIAVFLYILFSTAMAAGQSWIFQPGPYSGGQEAKVGVPATQPHAYATFTESQAIQAAPIPAPTFQWDPTGVGRRSDRREFWRHQERMESLRLRTYTRGVQDALGSRPVWAWHMPAPVPIPPIVVPLAPAGVKKNFGGRR